MVNALDATACGSPAARQLSILTGTPITHSTAGRPFAGRARSTDSRLRAAPTERVVSCKLQQHERMDPFKMSVQVYSALRYATMSPSLDEVHTPLPKCDPDAGYSEAKGTGDCTMHVDSQPPASRVFHRMVISTPRLHPSCPRSHVFLL